MDLGLMIEKVQSDFASIFGFWGCDTWPSSHISRNRKIDAPITIQQPRIVIVDSPTPQTQAEEKPVEQFHKLTEAEAEVITADRSAPVRKVVENFLNAVDESEEYGAVNPIGDIFILSDDELDKFIEDALDALKPENENMKNVYSMAILAILEFSNSISVQQIGSRAKTPDNLAIINAIYMEIGNYKLFPACNAYHVAEVITQLELLSIANYMQTKSMFDQNINFATAYKNIMAAYVNDKKMQVANNDPELAAQVEVEEPAAFVNAFLDMANGIPMPVLQPSATGSIIKKIEKLLVGTMLEGAQVQVIPQINTENPGSYQKLGMVNVVINVNGIPSRVIEMDMGGLMGGGKALFVNMKIKDSAGQIIYVPTYVPLTNAWEPILKNIVMDPNYVIDADTDPVSVAALMSYRLMPELYTYIDLSKKSNQIKCIAELGSLDTLSVNLLKVVQLPWASYGIGLNYCPRFRIRDISSASDFVLVSDSEVIVQKSWMALPFGGVPMKYFDALPASKSHKLIVRVKEGQIASVTADGKDLI